jgi:hypothetical protein
MHTKRSIGEVHAKIICVMIFVKQFARGSHLMTLLGPVTVESNVAVQLIIVCLMNS